MFANRRRTAASKGLLLAFATIPLLLSRISAAGVTETSVVKWDQRVVAIDPSSGEEPRAIRTLADGTIVTVLTTVLDVTVARRDLAGNFQAVGLELATARLVAIDACGDVLVVNHFKRNSQSDTDTWILKYDGVTGRPLWDKSQLFIGAGNVEDYPAALALDPEGDVYVTILSGATWRTLRIAGSDGTLLWSSLPVQMGIGSLSDAIAGTVVGPSWDLIVGARVDTEMAAWRLNRSTGAFVWGPMTVAPPIVERVRHAAIDDQNRLVFAIEGDPSALLLRLDPSNGSVVWSTVTGQGPFAFDPAPTALALGADGSVFVGGGEGVFPTERYFLSSHRITTGEPNWPTITFAARPFWPVALTPMSNGDVLFSGYFSDFHLVGTARVGRDGALVWGLNYTDALGGPLNGIDSAGNAFEIMKNWTDDTCLFLERSAESGQLQGTTSFDGWTGRTDLVASAMLPSGDPVVGIRQPLLFGTAHIRRLSGENGESVWDLALPGAWVQAIATDPAGNVILVTRDPNGEALSKLDGLNGTTVWGPVSLGFNEVSWSLAVDAIGNIVILKGSTSPPDPSALEKRSGINGASLWGPVTVTSPVFPALYLDPAGDILITGGHELSPNADWAVTKYSGATGAVAWGPVVFDRAGQADRASFARQLPGGDYVVAGTTGAAFTHEITLIRYAGATGAVVWGPMFIGGALPGLSFALDLKVDAAGGILVAGTISDVPQALMVAKLRPSDGILIWGPATIPDERPPDSGAGLEMDGAGNPMLFATTLAPEGDRDLVRASWDGATGAPRWGPLLHGGPTDDDFSRTLRSGGTTTVVGTVSFHFAARQPRAVAFTEELGVVNPPEVRFLNCGEAFSEQLEAANASGAVNWTTVEGEFPEGLTLSLGGLLSGTPTQVGEFLVTVQVQDSSLATATRELTIVVREDSMISIVATPVDDCTWMLSVPGSWTTYQWEPGGETTPTITVSPLNDTVYGVTVADASGCTVRGSILVRATRLIDPDCDAPGLTAISPTSGPAAGGTLVTLSGSQFEAATQTRVDAIPVSTSFQDASTLTINTPSLGPGTLNNVLVVNPNFSTAMLPNAFFADFSDVDQLHPFHDFIETLVRAHVTAGCGGGNYCPDSSVTREQMAVFLLRSNDGPAYTPPACIVPTFSDVPCFSPFARWINELVDRSVTAGCGGGNYCPTDPVTREQMAVFLLRTLEGPTYTPPDCTMPTFTDVPCSSPFARWIEELVLRNITAGCGGGLYCPLQAVTRGQMAVFLSETFGL